MIAVRAYAGRSVLVYGLARSGQAALSALLAGGANAVAWDDDASVRRAAQARGLPLADPEHLNWTTLAAVVLAPGIPLTHPVPHAVVKRARAAGVPVIGDVELFVGEIKGRRLAGITGTNGKSTTTALLGHVLAHAGRAVRVGGNIGTAVLDLEPVAAGGTYVVEMSSYQLDLTPSWHADVAVWLNLTPDHLDRHGGMAGYIAAKRKIFANQTAGDVAVIGVDDQPSKALAAELAAAKIARVVPISVGQPVNGVWVKNGRLMDGRDEVADLTRAPALPGSHNWQNAAAAYAAARALGLTAAQIAAGLSSFPGLAHRMERIAIIDGIEFVNDSKATNADAAAKALACYDNIYWIAGGRAKAGGIAGLADYWPRLRHAYLIGEAAPDFAATLAGRVPVTIAGTLDHAVAAAYAKAWADGRDGATVLLSPACASFDQFRDFEERGDSFRRLVAGLAARAPQLSRAAP
jgi:UDP-N-acetylmuramoylalanine--D-glutamate ligase